MSDYSKITGSVPFPATIPVKTDDVTLTGNGTIEDPLVSPPVTVSAPASTSMPAGTPVYLNSSGQLAPAGGAADVGAPATAQVVGLLQAAVVGGATATAQTNGVLELTTAQWDAVVNGESGGLVVEQSWLFLVASNGATGKLVNATFQITGPGAYFTTCGVPLSSTELLIQIGQPVA